MPRQSRDIQDQALHSSLSAMSLTRSSDPDSPSSTSAFQAPARRLRTSPSSHTGDLRLRSALHDTRASARAADTTHSVYDRLAALKTASSASRLRSPRVPRLISQGKLSIAETLERRAKSPGRDSWAAPTPSRIGEARARMRPTSSSFHKSYRSTTKPRLLSTRAAAPSTSGLRSKLRGDRPLSSSSSSDEDRMMTALTEDELATYETSQPLPDTARPRAVQDSTPAADGDTSWARFHEDGPKLISDSSRSLPAPCRHEANTNAVLDQEELAARGAPSGTEPAPWDSPHPAGRNSPLQDSPSQASSAALKLGPLILRASDVMQAKSRPASQRGGLCKGSLQGCVGLRNLGNTCFMNSVIQCLNAVPEFVKAVLGAQLPEESPDADRGTGVLMALAGLLRQVRKAAPGAVVNPSRLLDALAGNDARWRDREQQDAQEFLHSLLELLQLDMANEQSPPPHLEPWQSFSNLSEPEQAVEAWQREQQVHCTPLDALLGGLLQSTVCCSVCGRSSHSFEYFLDLSLPLPRQPANLTLEDCLAAFMAVEHLPASEGYHCAHCQQCQAVTKQLQLAKLPPVLILHLKRFSAAPGFVSSSSLLSKDTTPVQPRTDGLNLEAACSSAAALLDQEQPVYDLTSVCNHSGSLSGGHFTATCRVTGCAGDDVWLDFSDMQVKEATAPRLHSTLAYLLVYRRRLSNSTLFDC